MDNGRAGTRRGECRWQARRLGARGRIPRAGSVTVAGDEGTGRGPFCWRQGVEWHPSGVAGHGDRRGRRARGRSVRRTVPCRTVPNPMCLLGSFEHGSRCAPPLRPRHAKGRKEGGKNVSGEEERCTRSARCLYLSYRGCCRAHDRRVLRAVDRRVRDSRASPNAQGETSKGRVKEGGWGGGRRSECVPVPRPPARTRPGRTRVPTRRRVLPRILRFAQV
ncbi:hypothetical protein OF83DRAFT_23446 [Amylostereum chailletii]|nr:hypothetical protein OF83DRAFT_23446 [Amylostereum chailletii]